MNCSRAPEVSSSASRGRIGVTELALRVAHERECADCRQEQVSARVSLPAHPPRTPSRALLRSLGRTIVAARTGITRTTAWLTRGRTALSISMTSAVLASTRTIASFRLGSAWLKHCPRPMAQVPEATVIATGWLVRRLVRLRGSSTVRVRATARSTILLVRGLLTGLADRGRTAAAAVIPSTRHTSERCVGVPARRWSLLTPETGFLLRVCAAIAGLGILAMALIFAWPRQRPDNQWPDKAIIGPAGLVSATKPHAEPEPPETVSAPPAGALPIAPPVKEEVKATNRPPTPTPQLESAAPGQRPAPVLAREHAAPDAPDPSAAIDWLLKRAGATSRRDGPAE